MWPYFSLTFWLLPASAKWRLLLPTSLFSHWFSLGGLLSWSSPGKWCADKSLATASPGEILTWLHFYSEILPPWLSWATSQKSLTSLNAGWVGERCAGLVPRSQWILYSTPPMLEIRATSTVMSGMQLVIFNRGGRQRPVKAQCPPSAAPTLKLLLFASKRDCAWGQLWFEKFSFVISTFLLVLRLVSLGAQFQMSRARGIFNPIPYQTSYGKQSKAFIYFTFAFLRE